MTTAILLILFLMLLGLSAFFSGSETALTSANRTWIHELANKGDGRARLTSQFLQNGDRLLGITLVGNNIVNVCLTTIGSILLTRSSLTESPSLGRIPAGMNGSTP